ncbi:MAG TPA: T9SS type A sorting domain-containing protein [Ignavibacteriaceae bacterium]|nr:T9SS type A sorting domain-containing protein [Ignavibacteriaceae bacterium]
MKTYVTIASLILCFSFHTFSQTPNILWIKIIGANYADNRAYSVKQTIDNGYIITGYTDSFGAGGHDVWLLKTDTNGDTLWTKTYGGIYWDEGKSAQQTMDGGYIIAGHSKSFGNGGGHDDVWLIKTNIDGDTMWTKTFGEFNEDYGYSVQQTADNGYIITGETLNIGTGTNLYLIKTDSAGNSIWIKSYGGISNEAGYSVQQTDDGGFIIAGVAWEGISTALRNAWLIKTDNAGDTIWTKKFGYTMKDDWCHSVQQTSDGGYIIVGETTFNGNGGYDVWLIKTNTTGDTLWTKTFGGSADDYGYSVEQTSDDGYIICGYTESFGSGYFDGWLIRTDSNGDTLWTKTIGGANPDFCYSVCQTIDEGYIITGYTTSYGLGANKIWLIKVAADPTAIDETGERVINDYQLYQNYPNPFNPTTKIKYSIPNIVETHSYASVQLKVYDILGREIAILVNEKQKSGYYEVKWDASSQSSGVYFYRITVENYVETRKMILLR